MGKLLSNSSFSDSINNSLVLSQTKQDINSANKDDLYPVVKIKFRKLHPNYIKKNRRSAYSFMIP